MQSYCMHWELTKTPIFGCDGGGHLGSAAILNLVITKTVTQGVLAWYHTVCNFVMIRLTDSELWTDKHEKLVFWVRQWRPSWIGSHFEFRDHYKNYACSFLTIRCMSVWYFVLIYLTYRFRVMNLCIFQNQYFGPTAAILCPSSHLGFWESVISVYSGV